MVPHCDPILQDVFSALYQFHANEFITEDEWTALPPKTQDKIKRLAKLVSNVDLP